MILLCSVNIPQTVDILDKYLGVRDVELGFDTSCGSSVMPMSSI
jgi:hypothetical protein